MRVEQSIGASDQNLGHLEELVLKDTKEIQRKAVEEAAQKKAEGTPPRCPCCGNLLRRVTTGHTRSFETRFGSITIGRARGYCKRCHKWRFPADTALGLAETAGYSPSVQEMAALGVSKLPVAEAEMVIERLAGVKIPRATLDREAKRQGEQAQQLRQQMDEKAQTPGGAAAVNRAIQMELPLEPFTLVIMIDAWNIRERDEWGQSQKLRKKGLEPSRWHWVYNATVFRLPERVQSAGGRPLILSRGYVTTRWGIDALRSQLYAEAVRRGLRHAKQVLIIADGAVWIWNLAQDRFPQARQQLDLFHAKHHLWTVAHELHGSGTAQATAWVEPLLKQLEEGRVPRVINRLEEMLGNCPNPKPKWWGGKWNTSKTTGTAWIIERQKKEENPWAAEPLNQPADSINAVSNVLDNFGQPKAMKPSCVWKHFGATADGTNSSLMSAILTRPKIKMLSMESVLIFFV